MVTTAKWDNVGAYNMSNVGRGSRLDCAIEGGRLEVVEPRLDFLAVVGIRYVVNLGAGRESGPV